MRLDSLGKPPLVQSEAFEKGKVQPLVVQAARSVTAPESSHSDPGPADKSRLGRILSILQKGQDRKKKRKPRSSNEGLKAYQRASATEGEPVGQTLNIKV